MIHGSELIADLRSASSQRSLETGVSLSCRGVSYEVLAEKTSSLGQFNPYANRTDR